MVSCIGLQHLFLLEDDSTPYFWLQDRMIDKPALSPDGSKIAYCSATRGHIRIFSITDSSEKNLTPEQENAYQPTWSANGKFIAFLSSQESHLDSSPPFSNQLYIIPVDGGNPVQITSGDSLKF